MNIHLPVLWCSPGVGFHCFQPSGTWDNLSALFFSQDCYVLFMQEPRDVDMLEEVQLLIRRITWSCSNAVLFCESEVSKLVSSVVFLMRWDKSRDLPKHGTKAQRTWKKRYELWVGHTAGRIDSERLVKIDTVTTKSPLSGIEVAALLNHVCY